MSIYIYVCAHTHVNIYVHTQILSLEMQKTLKFHRSTDEMSSDGRMIFTARSKVELTLRMQSWV